MQHLETGSSRERLFLKAEILPTLITLDCLPIFFGHSSISMTVDVYGHWVPPGEGRAGLEAALAGGVRMGAGECKIVPMPVPNLQISANEKRNGLSN
jgi:hypothetical protein